MAEENVNDLSREETADLLAEIKDEKTDETDPSENSPPAEEFAEDILPDETSPEDGSPKESTAEAAPEKHKRGRALLRIAGRVSRSLLITAAAVVLIVNFLFPVVKIYGSSMGSTLVAGDIVIARKTTKLEQGDICAFNYGSSVLCKRVIGIEGDIIEMDGEGIVLVNGNKLEEPYVKSQTPGDCEIEFPFIVPKGSYFVLGDNRRSSVDSRNKVIGCVSEEQVVGKLIFRILPIPNFGKIE